MVTVTEVGIQWTVTSVARTSPPSSGVSGLVVEVSALDDDVDVDRDDDDDGDGDRNDEVDRDDDN